MRKKPIDSLERFYKEMDAMPSSKKLYITTFNSKRLKRLLKDRYYVESVFELWFDSEAGLDHNNWVDENSEGTWGMTQKDVDNMAKYIVRNFSHLTRRRTQKAIPRSYRADGVDNAICLYLYMRDRIGCDYMIFFKKRGEN
jgi:hypothetical protein